MSAGHAHRWRRQDTNIQVEALVALRRDHFRSHRQAWPPSPDPDEGPQSSIAPTLSPFSFATHSAYFEILRRHCAEQRERLEALAPSGGPQPLEVPRQEAGGYRYIHNPYSCAGPLLLPKLPPSEPLLSSIASLSVPSAEWAAPAPSWQLCRGRWE
eukprot:GGOE01032884.1.p4 GENE.GGOE01032884.1~~GGOE01032884.1.p4  ORF type:complete len:167 (-),score=23.87 GGOE01032884.1:1146-1613(-)